MKPNLIRKLKLLALPAALATLLALSLGMAQASSHPQEGPKQGIFGTVTATSERSITLSAKDGATVNLSIDANTAFRAPGVDAAAFADVRVGSRVAILAEGEADAQTALKVMVIPGEPRNEHRALTIIEVSGRTVVAQDAQGNQIEVELDHELSGDVQGQLVTFVGARSQQSNRFKAHAEVKIEQVVTRLEAHAVRIESQARTEVDASVRAQKEREAVEIKSRIEANVQRHLDAFTEVILRAPDQARPALQAALEIHSTRYQATLENVGGIRGEVKARLKLRTVVGSIKAIDTASGVLSLTTDSGGELTVSTDSNTTVNGKLSAVADLQVGDRVSVLYNPDNGVAAEIRARVRASVDTEVKVHATIVSVDSVGGRLVIKLRDGTSLGLAIDANTAVSINGQASRPGDLKPDMDADISYNTGSNIALHISATARGDSDVRGRVRSVDLLLRQIVVVTESNNTVVVTLDSSTTITRRGALTFLTDLQAGAQVTIRLVGSVAASIEIEAESSGSSTAPGRSSAAEADGNAAASAEIEAEGSGSVNLQ